MQRGEGRVLGPEEQIDRALGELPQHVGYGHGTEDQVHRGRVLRQPREQRRQEDESAEIRARQRERARARLGVERRGPREGAAHGLQGRCQRRAELLGARRGAQPQRRAHEERIAQERAQPAQRVAGGGLAQPHPLGRPRDAALGQERLEHHQEVQIDGG